MTLPTDTVFVAIGQAFDLSFLEKCGLDIEMTDRGMVKCSQDQISTSVPGLYVAGDLAYGPKLVIDAVASGKKAARAIHEYISKGHLDIKRSEIHSEEYEKEVSHN